MFFRIAAVLTVLIALYAGYEAYRTYAADDVSVWLAPTPPVMDYALGNPEGDVTVVEYLDYSCPYCRTIDPILSKAVALDGNVQRIPRPLTSSNPDGSTAARLFYAAAQFGKYAEAHEFLIQNELPLNQENFPLFAEAVGVEFNTLVDAYNDPSLLKAIRKNYNDFMELESGVTPTLVIGDTTFVPDSGMPAAEGLIAMFNQER